MKRFAAGLALGLLFSAGASRADWSMGDWATLKEIDASLKGIRVELQRLANAHDRLVSLESMKLPREAPPR